MNKFLAFFYDKNNSSLEEIFRKGFSTFIYKMVGLVLAYSVMLFITNRYGAEVFGRYSLTITLSQLLVMLFTFGLPTAIVKLTSDVRYFDQEPKSNYFKKGAVIILLSGILASFLLFLSSNVVSIHFFKDVELQKYIKILALLLLPLLFHEYFTNFFRGKKDFIKYNVYTFILPYICFFLIYSILINYYSHEGVIFLSYTIGIGFVFLLELVSYLKLKYKAKVQFDSKKLLKLSIPMLFSTTLLFLLNWTDVFMLGFMRSSAEVGVYNAAFKIASLGYLIIIPINVIIGPKVSELFSKNEFESLKTVIHKTTRMIALLTTPIVIVIIIGSQIILNFLGEEFIVGQTALIIISVGVLINASSGNVDQILNMTNSQNILRNITILCFVLNVVLNYFLIPIYGINGAAMASLITHIFLNGFSLYYIKKTLGFYTLF